MKTLKDKKRLILGLGQTGLSVARFLQKAGQVFHVMDTRDEAPGMDELQELNPDAYLLWNPKLFTEFDELVVSPGIAISDENIKAAQQQGVSIVGDIELFAQVNTANVISITGSNGKSTVTDLVTNMINASGKSAVAAGNYGVPALEVVNENFDFIVLELSSFQLETTHSLKSKVATILNVSEDHLDRYDSYQDYIGAKQRIYHNAELKVINADDDKTWTLDDEHIQFGIVSSETIDNDLDWKVDLNVNQILKGETSISELAAIQLQGIHNAVNIAAALSLVDACGIEITEAVVKALKTYKGLEHRCQLVCANNKVSFINDSKATNVGATIAALNSFSPLFKNIIIIAGGDAKGADLSDLAPVLKDKTIATIAFGQDAKAIALLSPANSHLVENMAQAVVKATMIAKENNEEKALVLLSPACASLDMYKNYQERGDEFSKLARALAC